MEDKVLIPYTEFKRLLTQEINLKNQIAVLEEEIQELENEVADLECNQLVEDEEELIDD